MRSHASPPDPAALEEHAGFVRALARGLLDADRADDVVQETWLAALRHPPGAQVNLRAWLAVVARNLAFRWRRSAQRRAHHEARAARRDSLPSAAELAERLELQRRVLDAVERLEEPFRSTLLYRYFDGLLPAVIAERLGIPVKTVKSRLHRALRTLRAEIGGGMGGDDAKWMSLLLPLAWQAPPFAGTTVAIGGIALAMKKKLALIALLLCLLGTGAVVWEKSRDPGTTVARAGSAREAAAVAPAEEERAEAVPPRPSPILREGDAVPVFTFAGRVVDADGEGIGDAELRLVYWTPGSREVADSADKVVRRDRERRERPTARADADGYFRFDRPYPSRSHLVATAEGFTPAVSEPCEPGAFVVIRMTRGAALRVTAVREDGQPVPDASVRLVTSPLGASSRAVLAEARTDVLGTAELPRSQVDIWIEVDARDPALAPAGERVDPSAEAVVVKIRGHGVRSCRILDGRTSSPVPGAYVISCRGGGLDIAEHRRFLADADGRVQVPTAGNELHFATAPGYDAAPVVAPEVQLWPAIRIEGRVVDAEGRPVEEAAILVAQPPGILFGRAYVGMGAVAAWSDGEGRFAVDDVTGRQGAPGAAQVRSVIAVHAEHPLAIVDRVAVEPGKVAVVDLRFPAPATLEVEVVDAAGAPMPQQWVSVNRMITAASEPPDDRRGAGLNVVSLLAGQHTLVTDARGRAEALRLPPGRYLVRSEGSTAETVLAEGIREKLRIVKGAGPAITGRVMRADGSPAASVCVGILGAPISAKTTDAEGRFRFADLPDLRLEEVPGGRFTVQVVLPDWRGVYDVPAKVGDDLVISLPSGPAKLRIEMENLPSDDTVVQYALATKTGGRDGKRVRPTGRAFETDAFTPGVGLLMFQTRGFGAVEVEFDAAAGRTTVIGVRLVPSGVVQGAVAPRDGGGPRHVRLTLAGAEAGGGQELRPQLVRSFGGGVLGGGIAADGSFRVEDVPPGSYKAALFEGIRQVAEREIEVRSGEATTVSFEGK